MKQREVPSFSLRDYLLITSDLYLMASKNLLTLSHL